MSVNAETETIRNKGLQFIRFSVVGTSGALINVAMFYLAVNVFHRGPSFGSVSAFTVAVVSNYSINRLWTFASVAHRAVPYFQGMSIYVAVNLVALVVNLIILNAVVHFFGGHYAMGGQIAGLIIGMGLNFLLARHFVFVRLNAHD